MAQEQEKERLSRRFILEEFSGELTGELEKRCAEPVKTKDDYLFIFMQSRRRSLFAFQNILWKQFLLLCPDQDDLMFVAEYIPNLRKKAMMVILKSQPITAKMIRYLYEYISDPEIILREFTVRQSVVFEARRALSGIIDNDSVVARRHFEEVSIENEKRPNFKKNNGKRELIKQLIRRELNARLKSDFYSVVGSDACRNA